MTDIGKPAVQIPRKAARDVQQAIENLVSHISQIKAGLGGTSSPSAGVSVNQQNVFIQPNDPGTYPYPIFWIKTILDTGGNVVDFSLITRIP